MKVLSLFDGISCGMVALERVVFPVKIKTASKYRCIGNGWTVDVIAHIFKGLSQPQAKVLPTQMSGAERSKNDEL